MTTPSKQYLDDLRALQGAPKVTYPYGGYTYPRIERVFTVPKGRVYSQPTTLPDFPGSLLVQVNETKRDQTNVEAYYRWDTLPGPVQVDISTDGETGIAILVAKQQVSAAVTFPLGEIVPAAINVQTISAANPTVVTLEQPHGLPPGAWVRFASTNSTPVLDGNLQIMAVPSPTQMQFAVNVTGIGGTSGTMTAINRIVRELRSTANQLVNVKIESMVAIPDITALNQDVACWKDYSFPDYLAGIDKLNDLATSSGASEVDISWSGGVGLNIQNGYRGPCQARRQVFYFMGPPPDSFATGVTPTFVLPTSGVVVIEGGSLKETTDPAGGTDTSTSVSYRAISIPATIHADDVGAGGGGGGQASFHTSLPNSVPAGFTKGDTITLVEEPQKWRVAAWRATVYLLAVPYTSGDEP